MSTSAYFIDQYNDLYGCGYYGVFGKSSNVISNNSIKIAENVKQIEPGDGGWEYITLDNKLYLSKYGGDIVEINNIEINDNTILYTNCSLISDNILYRIDASRNIVVKMKNDTITPYYNKYEEQESVLSKSMGVIKINEKVYIYRYPNVTKIEEKSNYTMRTVFENAIFVQGKESNISIIDRNGRIYESVENSSNKNIEGAKKIISSRSSKYVIKDDGTLWAKGAGYTGMWGDYIGKSDYVQITKDGNQEYIEKFTQTFRYTLNTLFFIFDKSKKRCYYIFTLNNVPSVWLCILFAGMCIVTAHTFFMLKKSKKAS